MAEVPAFVETWRALMLRKWPIMLFTALIAALAAFVVGQMVPAYRSTATLMVESAKTKIVSVEEVYSGAPVVLVLFSDVQCQYCREQSRLLRENLLKTYPKEVRLYFKDYPLDQIHPWARPAAIAARCVFRQNAPAFWDFHDLLFDKQADFSAANLKEKSLAWVTAKGLNAAQFTACFDSRATEKEVDRNVADGRAVGVNSTPMLFVNGRRLSGVLEWASLKTLIDLELNYQKSHANAGEQACCSVELLTPFTPRKK